MNPTGAIQYLRQQASFCAERGRTTDIPEEVMKFSILADFYAVQAHALQILYGALDTRAPETDDVKLIGLDDPELLHNTIAEAVGESPKRK